MSRERIGVLIGRQDLGESDRILRWLVPEEGRVSVVAKGARRPRNMFVGADLGVRARLVLEDTPRELGRILNMEVEEPRGRLREDLDRLTVMMHACEVVAALAREAHPEPRLYGLLEMTLLLLDGMDDPPGQVFPIIFEAKALSFAGLAPQFVNCTVCSRPIEAPLAWREGGVVHGGCAIGEGTPVTMAWAEAIETGRRQPLKDHYASPLPEGPEDALLLMVEASVGHPLGSRAWRALRV